MAVLSDYVSGTLTVTNGSTSVVGVGTGWRSAGFREGDTLFDIPGATEFEAVLAGVPDTQTTLTLTHPWEGPTQAGVTYRLRFTPDGARMAAQSRNLVEKLGNGNIEAFAGLTGVANGIPGFTGPGAMVIIDVDDIVPDGFVTNTKLADMATATLKGRATAGTGDPEDLSVSQALTLLKAGGAYAKDNILGTVSQSGGVPTGAIIERGSNANGEYVRFADGTQICTRNVTFDLSNASTFQAFVYPAAWAAGSTPAGALSFNSSASSGSDATWWNNVGMVGVYTTISQWSLLFRGTAAATTGQVRITAFGRWWF